MKLLSYGTAWVLVISQWNDLLNYLGYTNTPAPIGAIIITVLATAILTVVTFKELTKKGQK